MRTIDADTLKELIELQRVSCVKIGATDRAEAYANCLWKIAQAPTIGGWISVKDRLPEEGVYLGCHGSSVGIFGYWFGEWVDEDDCICGENYVTHWMPLPEPPKEGERG